MHPGTGQKRKLGGNGGRCNEKKGEVKQTPLTGYTRKDLLTSSSAPGAYGKGSGIETMS